MQKQFEVGFAFAIFNVQFTGGTGILERSVSAATNGLPTSAGALRTAAATTTANAKLEYRRIFRSASTATKTI